MVMRSSVPPSRPGCGRRRGGRAQADGQQDEAEGVCGLLLQHQPQEGAERHQPGVLRHQVTKVNVKPGPELVCWRHSD